MNLSEFFIAVSAALDLLAAHPMQWLGIGVVFLVFVESLMFIPYIGFMVKLAVAGIMGTQVLAMFAAASKGIAPSPVQLLSAFSFPMSTQLVLAFASIFPFAAGMIYLYLKSGPSGIRFFFGNMFVHKPPVKALMMKSKYVMLLFGLPFMLLAGEVIIRGSSGFKALLGAVAAAPANWLPILLISLIAVMFELLMLRLPMFLPKWAAGVLSGILLLLFVCWGFAVTYTVSAVILG